MKKVLAIAAFLCAMFASQNVMAGTTSKTYYVKATVKVAPESTGRGSVYFLDSNDSKVTTGVFSETSMSPQVSVPFVAEPEEGYEFAGFTYESNEGDAYDDGHYVYLTSTSQSPDGLTNIDLLAHFKEKVPEDPNYHFTKTVYEVVKYNTMVIPAECELPANVVAYTVDNVEGDALIVTKLSGKVPAGTAVLLENTTNADIDVTATFDKTLIVAGDHQTGLLKGSYVNSTNGANAYDIMISPSRFTQVPDHLDRNAFDCRLYVEGGAEEYLLSKVATAINAITNAQKTQIFDAAGRSLNGMQKGLNIVNGVKVMVK